MNKESGKVLLVEDSADDIAFTRVAFQKMGLAQSLKFVSGGQQAIDYLRGEWLYSDRESFPVPDLLLLDIRMPDVDGFEVLKWIRAHEEIKHLPVIVFSGLVRRSDIQRAYELGANSVVEKPFGIEDFYRALQALAKFWLSYCKLLDFPR